jgi:hypothetical protein
VVSYFLRYFSSTSTEQISSFDPVGFAIFATLRERGRTRQKTYLEFNPLVWRYPQW